MKKLENLKWASRWVSHLGCIKGCLDYLNLDVSDACRSLGGQANGNWTSRLVILARWSIEW